MNEIVLAQMESPMPELRVEIYMKTDAPRLPLADRIIKLMEDRCTCVSAT